MGELKVGDQVPAFTAEATAGEQFNLEENRGKNIVIYFYPKDNTPGCTSESVDFKNHYQQFKKLGVVVVGVSRDSIASHEKFKAKYELPFPLLSDKDSTICNIFGVYKGKTLFGKLGFGIERSTFIIDKQGKIARQWRKVKVKGHVEEVLAALKEI